MFETGTASPPKPRGRPRGSTRPGKRRHSFAVTIDDGPLALIDETGSGLGLSRQETVRLACGMWLQRSYLARVQDAEATPEQRTPPTRQPKSR